MKTHLLIIDPQNSFCDPRGELFVDGAQEDMERLASFIEDTPHSIDRITVTLDSHNRVHIAHPVWWMDETGKSPEPFTRITFDEVRAGRWKASSPENQAWSEHYMKQIGSHVIWPLHCLIGSWGHEVVKPLNRALTRWAEKKTELDFLLKGSCRYTEHFSAVKPSVEVPDDPSTLVNQSFLKRLDESETLLVAGEASSHCVAGTVRDLINYRENLADKITLMSDTMSPVPGFENNADAFFNEMERAGLKIESSKSIG